MLKRLLLFILVSLGALITTPALAADLAPVAAKTPCESLRLFDPKIPDYPVQITSAKKTTANDREVCEVSGYIAPQIRFVVRLPLAGWTQRYLQTGCGGLCGILDIRAPQRDCPALVKGDFVLASTDMGHEGMGGVWGANDPQLRVDFGYRGVHATAVIAKALIARYYGQAPRYSYFSGCSDGGREALMEAQRYPDDFDGIAAGAPALNFLVQNTFYHAWNARVQMRAEPDMMPPPGNSTGAPAGPLPSTAITAADLPVLHAAAIAACDALDGARDGLIAEPLKCRFDPHVVQCRPGQTENCLSSEAADAATELYRGAHDDAGRKLVVGTLMPGSELAWKRVEVPIAPGAPVMSGIFAADTIHWLAFPKPLAANWTIADFRFDETTMRALMAMHATYDATDPDLGSFAGKGGKLLIWHGLSDPHISPTNSIAYVQAVQDLMGKNVADAMLRLFLVPGMYHCGDGDGLTSIDVLTPLMAWVENGKAPDSLVASKDDATAKAGKGRTIYPWPATSALKRGADPEMPASWLRKEPAGTTPKLYAGWLGADLFKTGFQQDCGFDGSAWTCKSAR